MKIADIKEHAEKYYGYVPNIVQVFKDPKVANCYVYRCEGGEMDNWCFVVNFDYGDSIDKWMVDDVVELEPKQKLSKKLFGELRFF